MWQGDNVEEFSGYLINNPNDQSTLFTSGSFIYRRNNTTVTAPSASTLMPLENKGIVNVFGIARCEYCKSKQGIDRVTCSQCGATLS